MSRRTWNIIGILILMGITSLVSVFGYIYFVGGSGEASQPISAPTLSVTQVAAEAQVIALSTQVAELQSANATLSALNASGAAAPEATAEGTDEAAADPTEEGTAEAAAAGGIVLFRIVPEESEVRFSIMEDLNGQPNLVVGRTEQVAGDIVINLDSPSGSQVGTIRINARTLVTDSEFRNRAIRAEILESTRDEYEFIEFTPTALSDLPDSVTVGEEISFQVTGDLKIRDISQPVTFDVTATLTADDRLEGTATALVTRAQYNLSIPNAPGVSNVVEDVTLEIEFVAAQVDA
jgi:polyisoprenoid-binding protein YceI